MSNPLYRNPRQRRMLLLAEEIKRESCRDAIAMVRASMAENGLPSWINTMKLMRAS